MYKVWENQIINTIINQTKNISWGNIPIIIAIIDPPTNSHLLSISKGKGYNKNDITIKTNNGILSDSGS